MKRFSYRGRNADNTLCQGEILAEDETQAVQRLQSMGVRLLSLSVVTVSKKSAFGVWQRRLTLPELAIFCRQFHALMKAGVPLLRAINGLAQSCDQPTLKNALCSIQPALLEGASLSVAMSAYPNVFPPLFLAMVQVGENTGRLDRCLWQLAVYYEQEGQTWRQVKSALRYPSFVLLALAAALAVIHVKVIPPFARLFERMDVPLPWPTQVLMTISDGLLQYGLMIFITLVLFFLGFGVWRRTSKGRLNWDRQRLNWPILGALWHRALLGRFANAFGLMLQAGVPISQALALSQHVVENCYLQTQLLGLKQGIEQGQSVAQMSMRLRVFPPLVQQMLAVGEETGQLDDLLLDIADFYDKEVQYQLRVLSARLEPILLMLVSILVLILAMGIFLPMWNLLDLAKTFA